MAESPDTENNTLEIYNKMQQKKKKTLKNGLINTSQEGHVQHKKNAQYTEFNTAWTFVSCKKNFFF